MAVRYAKLEYPDVLAFVKAWEEQIKKGSVYLPPGVVAGEAAPEIKLDLVVPGLGRVGPLPCQVVMRAPDGGLGLQIPELPAAAEQQARGAYELLEAIRDYLVARGELIPADEVERVIAERVAQALAEAAPGPAGTQPAAAEPAAAQLTGTQPAAGGAQPAAQRGLPLPELGGRAPDMRGSLSDKSLRDGLMHLAVERSTGLLTLELPGGERKYGFWSKGGPVGWRSEPLNREEVLGVLLYRAGQVTKEQLQRSLEIMEEQGCRQGEAFIELGIMSFSQLVMVLQKQCEYIFLKVLEEGEGAWTFHLLDELPERFYNPALKASNVLYRRLTRQIEEINTTEIYSALRPSLDRYVFVREEMREVMGAIGWSKDERRFLDLVQARSWRLRELFSVSNMSRRATARFIYALLDLGFVAFQEEEDPERYMKRITDQIMGKFYRVQKVHHFDVLEVHWISLQDEIEAGYKNMKARYRAGVFHDLSPELEQALELINRKLDAAYAVLRDPARRRAYREEIIEKDMIINSADLLAKKGEMAIMRADAADAQACWGKAVELMPNRKDFRDGLLRAKAIKPS